jgi:hypothetical protein
MTALFFVIAITLAVGTVGYKSLTRRKRRRLWSTQTGCSPQKPVVVRRFDEMNHFVAMQRCPCGGRPSTVSEGSRSIHKMTIRVIRAQCVECEEELDFFFNLTHLEH